MRTKWLLPCLLLVGCGSPAVDPTAAPVLRTETEFNEALKKATSLSKDILARYDLQGENPAGTDIADLKEALRLMKGVVAFEPTRYAPALLAGKIAMALQEYEDAEQLFEQSLANIFEPIPDKDIRFAAELHSMIGHLAVLRNDLVRADFATTQALKLVPKNPEYMAGRASVLIQQNHKADAQKLLVDALKVDPGNRRANQLLTLLNLKEVEEGKRKAGL